MKRKLGSSNLTNKKYLFGSREQAHERYHQLKKVFLQNNDYMFFAEPVFSASRDRIDWFTEIEGQFLNFNNLTLQDKGELKNLVSRQTNYLLSLVKSYNNPQLENLVKTCLEIPEENDIFVVRTPSGEKRIVLTMWGFINDIPGSDKGIIGHILSLRVPMKFFLKYHDNQPATDIGVLFRIDNEERTIHSNYEGIIQIENVKIDLEIEAVPQTPNSELAVYKFRCVENGIYEIVLFKYVEILLHVVGSVSGKPKANERFVISIAGEKKEFVTNEDGKIVVPKVLTGKEFHISHIDKNGNHLSIKTFTASETNREHFITIHEEVVEIPPVIVETPPEYKMRIKVIDPKNNIVPGSEVEVVFKDKKERHITGEDGCIVITGVEPGTKVKVTAVSPKKK